MAFGVPELADRCSSRRLMTKAPPAGPVVRLHLREDKEIIPEAGTPSCFSQIGTLIKVSQKKSPVNSVFHYFSYFCHIFNVSGLFCDYQKYQCTKARMHLEARRLVFPLDFFFKFKQSKVLNTSFLFFLIHVV